jgi:hypothetical protein
LTKGKNERELVDLCRFIDIACTRTAEKSRRVGREKQWVTTSVVGTR